MREALRKNATGRVFVPALLQARPSVSLATVSRDRPRGCVEGVLACEPARWGQRVARLPLAAYGGYKDVNAAWTAGELRLVAAPAAAGERAVAWKVAEALRKTWAEPVTLLVAAGGRARTEAERLT